MTNYVLRIAGLILSSMSLTARKPRYLRVAFPGFPRPTRVTRAAAMSCRLVVTVEPALFLFMFSTFMSYPLMYQLVYQRVCQAHNCSSSNDANKSHANSSVHSCPHTASDVQTRVEDDTSSWILYINVANSVPSILAALAFGAWSDRVGRKVVISLPAIGLSVNAGFVLLVWYLHLSLPVLFAGQIVSGFLGGFATFNMGVFAYMSDVTSSASRTTRIGILESMIFLGAMLGDLIGGVWVRHGNFGPAFWCIFAAGVVVLLYVKIIVRESRLVQSLSDDGRKCRTFFSCNNLAKSACLFVQSRRPYWPLVLGVSVFVLASVNFAGIIDVVVLYVFDWPLCWSSDRLGFFLAAKMGMNGVANLFVLPLLKYARLSDFAIINLGLVFGAASLILMGLAYHTWMMYLGKLKETDVVLCFHVVYVPYCH